MRRSRLVLIVISTVFLAALVLLSADGSFRDADGGEPMYVAARREPHVPAAVAPVVPRRAVADAVPRTAAASAVAEEAPLEAPDRTSLDAAFAALLLADLGPVVSKAVYDPAILPALVGSCQPDGSSALGPILEDFDLYNANSNRRAAIGPPTQQLLALRRTTALGLGRMHRDSALHAMFTAASSPTARRVVLQHIRRAARAFVTHFFIGLQVIIDMALDDSAKRQLRERQHWTAFDVDTDPLLLIAAAMRVADGAGAVEKLLARVERGDFLSELVPRQRTSGRAFVRSLVLEYHRKHISTITFTQGHGKVWNYFRPVTGCSSITRTCEEPEACRLLCNPNYFTSAGDTAAHHRFIGFGSNNAFDWEETTARLFAARSSQASVAAFNGMRSMTTLDCTVQHWNISGYMTRQPNYFTGRICIDQAESNGDRIRIDALKQLVLDGEQGIGGSKLERKGPAVAVPAARAGHAALFDAVAIFKMDVEGHEHPAIAQWAKLELLDLQRSKGTALSAELAAREAGGDDVPLTLLDFERDVPSFFTVSLFQLELHERVDDRINAYVEPVLQGFRLQQHLASLGFVAVTQEVNAWGDCCYEMVYAHYRFLIRSEVWSGFQSS